MVSKAQQQLTLLLELHRHSVWCLLSGGSIHLWVPTFSCFQLNVNHQTQMRNSGSSTLFSFVCLCFAILQILIKATPRCACQMGIVFLGTGGGSGGGGAGGNGGNAGSNVSNALVGDREKDRKKLAPVSITLVSFAVSRKAYTKVGAGSLHNTAHGDGQTAGQSVL